jgi:2-polyprenyl-6-methoxyphenol hydroxylase-like FAD-dependent oxidoreductase
MSENLKVAIIGAGLGGLAVAIALHKQNINAQVYEKAQQLRPVGAGLSLFPNGLNTLDAIAPGIVESLKHAGSPTRKEAALMMLTTKHFFVVCQSRQRQVNLSLKIGFIITNHPNSFGLNY